MAITHSITRRKYERRIKIVVAIIALLLMSYCILYPKWVIWNVESLMDTSIPDDAENVQYNFVTWQGSSFDLRFDYPPDKIPGFLAKTCFSSLDSLQDNYMMFANDWWHPDEASTNGRIWVGGECAHHGGVFVWIVIDVTNPLEYSIYMSGGVS